MLVENRSLEDDWFCGKSIFWQFKFSGGLFLTAFRILKNFVQVWKVSVYRYWIKTFFWLQFHWFFFQQWEQRQIDWFFQCESQCRLIHKKPPINHVDSRECIMRSYTHKRELDRWWLPVRDLNFQCFLINLSEQVCTILASDSKDSFYRLNCKFTWYKKAI